MNEILNIRGGKMKKVLAIVAIAVLAMLLAPERTTTGHVVRYIPADEVPMVTYQKEVATGDTIWSICSKVATDQDDLQKLVWETMQLNHIEDPGNLQPGTELIIRVKKAREL